jgi:catechol 2,3-dioxygenase-like lactoylglutathione lyase family enzyme
MAVELDHVVIHIDDWDACNSFYASVLDAKLVENPEAAGNPLAAFAYRFGDQQVNVHGPWPGTEGTCCPPPLNEVGRGDLAFRSDQTIDEIRARLDRHGIAVTAGPTDRFGARGWGTSIYCHDPSGNGIGIITSR